jgi:hypothetical protein
VQATPPKSENAREAAIAQETLATQGFSALFGYWPSSEERGKTPRGQTRPAVGRRSRSTAARAGGREGSDRLTAIFWAASCGEFFRGKRGFDCKNAKTLPGRGDAEHPCGVRPGVGAAGGGMGPRRGRDAARGIPAGIDATRGAGVAGRRSHRPSGVGQPSLPVEKTALDRPLPKRPNRFCEKAFPFHSA